MIEELIEELRHYNGEPVDFSHPLIMAIHRLESQKVDGGRRFYRLRYPACTAWQRLLLASEAGKVNIVAVGGFPPKRLSMTARACKPQGDHADPQLAMWWRDRLVEQLAEVKR